MKNDQHWLNVPQAIILEATRNIELALDLKDQDSNMLVVKANSLLATRTEIPLKAEADEEQRLDAFRKLREAMIASRDENRYLQAQGRVHERLLAGVTTRASRMPNGSWENVDPLELTRVELCGVHAVDKGTEHVRLFDLRINMFEYFEHLIGKPIDAANTSSPAASPELNKDLSLQVEEWDCPGDPLPKLVEWAQSKWGADLQNLPSRSELLRIFRQQFGRVLGINENTMREVRRRLAPAEARRGGAPTHRRQIGK